MTAPMLHPDYQIVRRTHADLRAMGESFEQYMRAVNAAAERLPGTLHEFIVAPWHHDHTDRRALHDMRLRRVTVHEGVPGDPRSTGIAVEIVLLGAYFDRELTLRYDGVTRYQVALPPGVDEYPSDSHGDLLNDEIALRDDGTVVHALEFSRGTVFEIAFAGPFAYAFTDLAPP